jgi:hypothetical protein
MIFHPLHSTLVDGRSTTITTDMNESNDDFLNNDMSTYISETSETDNLHFFLTQGTYVCLRIGGYVLSIGYLVFHIMVIYALVETHTPKVMDTCGFSLWLFLLMHLILPLILLFILCCAMLCIYALTVNLMLDTKQLLFYYWVVIVLAIVYFAVMCSVGAYLLYEASKNLECKEAILSSTSGMQPPLLTTLGWVYVALDGANLLLSIGILVALGYVNYFLP